jgi:hypothetical protein
MFMAPSATCNTTSAGAALYSPQTAHSTLLSRKIQKPTWRRMREDDATNQAAHTVTTMATHCNTESQLSKRFSLQRGRRSIQGANSASTETIATLAQPRLGPRLFAAHKKPNRWGVGRVGQGGGKRTAGIAHHRYRTEHSPVVLLRLYL